MTYLQYQDDELYIDNVSLNAIAQQFGTPCYVYSQAVITANWQAFDQSLQGLSHRICYAVKANSNLSILKLLATLGSGFDIVSKGELERVIRAGGDPNKIIFSGVGKTQLEIEYAIEKGIYCFNVESKAELIRLNAIASHLKTIVNIAIRMNPNVNAGSHAHISTGLSENKFGIDMQDVIPLCESLAAFSSLKLIGIASHIGSQIIDITPLMRNIDCLIATYHHLKTMGIVLKHINVGGGLGITYHHEEPPAIAEYSQLLKEKIAHLPLEVILEPGRAIVGNAGILLTRIEYLKHTPVKNFAIVDAGMNDLLRPALYDAWQNILSVSLRHTESMRYDIAGPVCESADFLGKDRDLSILAGDLLAIHSAGAYCFSMSSNYNSRCKAAEVLIKGDKAILIRRRETTDELFAAEEIL